MVANEVIDEKDTRDSGEGGGERSWVTRPSIAASIERF
jgi:hypothetical protein